MNLCIALRPRSLRWASIRWFATAPRRDQENRDFIDHASIPVADRPTAPKRDGRRALTPRPQNKKYALTENRKQHLQLKAKAAKKLIKRKRSALLTTRPAPTSRLQLLQQAVVQGDANSAYEIAERLQPSVSKFDQLLCVCAKNGKVRQAFKTFSDMKKANIFNNTDVLVMIRPTIFSFNYMINAIAEGKGEGAYFERANWLLGEMDRFHVKMNIATLNVFLKVCINHGHEDKAITLCENMEAQEIEPDLVTYSLWISAHKKRLDKQNPSAVQTDAIHKMEDNQTVTNKTRDELKPIFEIYNNMTKKNIQPHIQFFNTWLRICKSSSGPSIVFEVFAEMKKARVQADYRTYDILLSVCAQTNRIEYGMDMFKTIMHSKMPIDTQLANSLLRLSHVVYFNAQSSTDHDRMRAVQFLEQVLEFMNYKALRPNLDTYQLLLSVYGRQGDMTKVNETFSQLEAQGLKPTVKTYTALLAAFRHSEQIEAAQTLYRSLVAKKFPMDGVFLRLLLKIMRGAKRMDYAEEIVHRLREQEESVMAPRLQRAQEMHDEEAALRAQGRLRVAEYHENKRMKEHNREYKNRRLDMKARKQQEGEVHRDGRAEVRTSKREPGPYTSRATMREERETENEKGTPGETMAEENNKEEVEIDAGVHARRTSRQNSKLYSRSEEEVFTPEVNETLFKVAMERHRGDQSKKEKRNTKAAPPPQEIYNLSPDTDSSSSPVPLLPLEQLRQRQQLVDSK